MKLFSLASAFCLLAVGNGLRHRAQDTLQTGAKTEMEMVNAETKSFVQLSVQDHYAAVNKQMEDMTTSEAIMELKKRGVPDELIEMMQEMIAERKPLPPSNISGSFKKVIDKINEMIAYVQMEYDVAELTCRGALEDLRDEIAAEASNMDLIQTQTGETQSFLLDWNNRKEEASKNIARVEEELSKHRAWCASEIAATEESIRIYTDDYAQARFVYDKTMSKCVEKKKSDPTSVASGTERAPEPATTVSLADFSAQLDAEIAEHTDAHGEVLLRCVNWMGRSFITFQHPKVAKAVLTMSRRFRNKFHTRLSLMANGEEPNTAAGGVVATPETAKHPVEQKAPVATGDKTEFNKNGDGKDDHANTSTEIKDTESLGKTQEAKAAQADASNEEKQKESPLTITTASATDPVGLIIPDALKNAGCTDSMGNMTSEKFKEMCVKVKEAIGELIDEVNNELHKQQAYLAETKQNCTHIEADLSEELKNYNDIKATAMSRIAMLSSRLTALQTDSRTAFANYQKRTDEFKAKLADCKTSFSQAITGACAAKKIKKEISAISVAPVNPIIECQVTGWNENEAQCSAACGDKGIKQLSRKVSVEPTPVWGAPCPALTAERNCNRKTCPIDCVVGSWNPFTPCSAKCNTGTRFRFKDIITEPRYHGAACGDVENLEFCNHEACDQDCALYPWTEFTPCDRACGTGMKYRRRNIQVEKKGQGYCPSILDDRRFELAKCNTQQCPEAKPVCQSKVDVVLLMDTSGSIGQDGFAASKQFAVDFINQMKLGPDGVAIGMVAFSDRPYIVTPLNYTKETILKDVEEGFLWDAGLTATASALSMALQLLDNGARPGAMPIVVVVTDGMPTGIEPDWSEWYDTPGVAASVRARARLMFLSVGAYVEETEIMSWATDGGDHNNYAHIHEYPVLIKALDELVVSLCPEIGTVDNSPVSAPEEAPKTVLFGKTYLRSATGNKPVLVQSQNRATWTPKGVMWGEQRKAVLADRSQGTDPFEGFDTSLPY